MQTQTFQVQGMTCGHCVASVTEELKSIAGVLDVVVDLGSGRVEVTSDVPLDPVAVRGAVEEAGYALA